MSRSEAGNEVGLPRIAEPEADCRWCEGDGRVTAAPIHNGHEIEALRIRIVCPVCGGTGRDE